MRGLMMVTGMATASIAASRPNSRRFRTVERSASSSPRGRHAPPALPGRRARRSSVAASSTFSWVASPLREFGGPMAFAQNDDAVAHADELGHLGGDQDDRHALCGKVGDHRVHFRLGADIDALRRLVEDEDARLGAQPFGQHHFLLVAAGQFLDRLPVTRRSAASCASASPRPGRSRDPCRRGRPRAALSRTGSTALSRIEKSITRLWPMRSSET